MPFRAFVNALGALGLGGLVLALGGCPLVAGIDSDYATGGAPVDGGGGLADVVERVDRPSPIEAGKRDASSPRDSATKDTAGQDVVHAPEGSPPSDVSTTHEAAPNDTGIPEASIPDGCAPATCLTAPPGWTLVAYDDGPTAACPAGFTDLGVVEPTNGGSCACSACSVTAQPDCENGTISSTWNLSGGSTCDGVGGYFPAGEGACQTDQYGNATYSSFTGPPPKGGACTATATPTEPTTTMEHLCTPGSCPSEACGAPSPFGACLYQAGDQACPAQAATKHSVGTSASASCSGCGCTVSAGGCSGSMAFFNDTSACGAIIALTVPANGTCTSMAAVSEGASFVYSATATGVACNAGTSTATLAIAGQGTVCCP